MFRWAGAGLAGVPVRFLDPAMPGGVLFQGADGKSWKQGDKVEAGGMVLLRLRAPGQRRSIKQEVLSPFAFLLDADQVTAR